jgi:hypothetical protein
VTRVGGGTAGERFNELLVQGNPPEMSQFVAAVANQKPKPAPATDSENKPNKRKQIALHPMHARVNVWAEFGTPRIADLVKVVQKLLCCNATSCAVERNWSLWGRSTQPRAALLARSAPRS